jgi:hypothetical protein
MSEQPLSNLDPVLSLRPRDAAKALGIGTRKLWELTADRTSGIPHFRLGKAVLYPVRELQDWLAEHSAKGGK